MRTNKIRAHDKLLPTQEFFSNQYEGDNYLAAISNMCSLFSNDYDYKKFNLEAPLNMGLEEMSTPPVQLSLLMFLVNITKAKSILEIGTFIGNTTMHLSENAGLDSKVTSIEFGQEFYDIACRNIKNNGFSSRIELIHSDAKLALNKFEKNTFDMIFIDGSKEDYLEFSLLSEKLLKKNGIIIIDDVFFHGDALNDKPKSNKGIGCKLLLNHYLNETNFKNVLLPISNGILLLQK
jgi:caffeoyl-CoA O-methyltransferase